MHIFLDFFVDIIFNSLLFGTDLTNRDLFAYLTQSRHVGWEDRKLQALGKCPSCGSLGRTGSPDNTTSMQVRGSGAKEEHPVGEGCAAPRRGGTGLGRLDAAEQAPQVTCRVRPAGHGM